MDILKEVLSLLQALAWPATILTIALMFRTPILGALHGMIRDRRSGRRNLRLRVGGFEIESQLAEKAQELFEQVAQEPDMDKRLHMIKAPILLEAVIPVVERKDVEALTKLQQSQLTNSFHVNWHNPELDGFDLGVCRRLEELGLISMAPMYDGDEIGHITPVGIALLDRLSSAENEPNEALQPTQNRDAVLGG